MEWSGPAQRADKDVTAVERERHEARVREFHQQASARGKGREAQGAADALQDSALWWAGAHAGGAAAEGLREAAGAGHVQA